MHKEFYQIRSMDNKLCDKHLMELENIMNFGWEHAHHERAGGNHAEHAHLEKWCRRCFRIGSERELFVNEARTHMQNMRSPRFSKEFFKELKPRDCGRHVFYEVKRPICGRLAEHRFQS